MKNHSLPQSYQVSEQNEQFECKICHKKFTESSILTEHIMEHLLKTSVNENTSYLQRTCLHKNFYYVTRNFIRMTNCEKYEFFLLIMSFLF